MAFRVFSLAACLGLAACSSPEEMTEKIEETRQKAAASPAAAAAARDVAESEESELLSFGYAYPAAASAIAPLAAVLEADARAQRAELGKAAREGQAAAKEADFPYRAHTYEMTWKVVADTPTFLSLSGDFATYSGGAHGMYGLRSLVWDKRAGRSLDGSALFVSPEALDKALGARLCDALNAERAKRRGEPVAPESADEFDRCVSTAEATVLIGSSGGTAFDRIGIWFGPYVAGSYAEGAYEFDFPVDGAVMRAVKPVYRSAFAP